MFGSSQKTAQPEVAGTTEEDISTNQEALPVPYIAGERKVAVRWMTDVYNQYTVEVQVDTGKKGADKKGGGGAAGSGTYDYFGSLAGAVCVGQTDELVSIALDGKQVWALGNVYRESSPQPFVGTIPGYGVFHFYWGAEDQTLDPTSILNTANNEKGHQHPNYRGVSFIEFRDLLFGREKVTAPSVEIVIARRPVQNLITGVSSNLDDNQILPLCSLAELMTNKRFGLGMPDATFDAISFQETADALDNKDLVYCSPFLNNQTSLREAVSQATTITDSFLTWDSSSGKIKAGYWTHEGIPDVGTLPSIQETDLTETPDFDSSGWSESSTGWDVVFSDREKRYKESSEKYDDISLLSLVGFPRRETLNRSWITRRTQALAHATEWGKTFSRPALSGELVVRRRRAALIDVGGYFRLDIDVEPGGDSLLQVCRCISKSKDDNGPVTIEFVAETSLAPTAYTRPATGGTTDPDTFPIPNALDYVRPVEMPVSFQGTEYAVVVLAQRGDNTTVGFNVLYDKDEAGAYTNIGNQRKFGVRAALSGAFADTVKGIDDAGYDPEVDASPVVDITLSNDIDLASLPDDTGEIGAREDQLVLMLMEIETTGPRTGQIKLDGDGFAMMEMLSVAAITAEVEGTRTLSVMRGRFSTKRRTFSDGAEAWLIRKSALELYSHNDFPGEAATESPMYFKTEPFNIFQPREATRDFVASGSSTTAINSRFSYTQATDSYWNGDYEIRHVTDSWVLYDTDGTTALYSVLSSDEIPPNTGWVDLVGTDTLVMSEFKETFYFPTARYFAPKITITTQPPSAVIGVPKPVIGTITDADGDLSFWSVSYRRDGSTQETVVAGGPIEPTGSLSFNVPLRFTDLPVSPATTITYDVIIRAKDSTAFIDGYVEEIFQVSTALATSVIGPPSGFTASNDTTNTPARFKSIWLEWTNPTDPEFAPFDKVEIFSSTTNDYSTASFVLATSAPFASVAVEDDNSYYFWIRAKDRAGNISTVVQSTTVGKARLLITNAADIQANEIIANTANLANLVVTDAKIASLSAAKITAGTIDAETITLGVDPGTSTGIIKSASYDGAGAGWRIDGDGLADFADLIVRGDTVVQSAETDVIRSANYVPGTSGWVIKGDGSAEFWNVNIYGSVPLPRVYVGVTEIPDGGTVTGLFATTMTVTTPAGCVVYYTDDGTAPDGTSTQLPLDGQLFQDAASNIIYRFVAIETSTARSSDVVSVTVDVCLPCLVFNGTSYYIRTKYKPANYVWCALWVGGYDPYGPSTYGALSSRSFAPYTNPITGLPDGYITSALGVPTITPNRFRFFFTGSTSTTEATAEGSIASLYFTNHVVTGSSAVLYGFVSRNNQFYCTDQYLHTNSFMTPGFISPTDYPDPITNIYYP